MIQRLAVVGLGLLGGSVVRAVRARALAKEIVAVGRRMAALTPALDSGVIDPTKVTRLALQSAASVAGYLVTTEALITDIPEKKDSAPMPGGHGGGYGGGDMY